jgi:hypothetical protein
MPIKSIVDGRPPTVSVTGKPGAGGLVKSEVVGAAPVQGKPATPITVSLAPAGERIVQLYNAWRKPDEAARRPQEVLAAEFQAPGTKELVPNFLPFSHY